MIEHLRYEQGKGTERFVQYGGQKKIREKMWWKWFNQNKVCRCSTGWPQTQAIKAAMIGLGLAGFKQEEKDIKLKEVSTEGDQGGVEWREGYDQTT